MSAFNLEKPPEGDPCNGCGLCCLAEQCPVSQQQFGVQNVCPALEQVEEHYQCGLMLHPGRYNALVPKLQALPESISATYYQLLLGGGLGCDTTD